MKTCGDCQHWSANVEGGDAAELADVARCLRFPPSVDEEPEDGHPRTRRTTWACGEFSQRPPLEAQHYRLIVQGNDNMDLRREFEALGAREPPPQVVADASSEEAEET